MTGKAPHSAKLLEQLKSVDTPTICNALEIVAPERRLTGFTIKPLVCPFPDLPPIVGYARTGTVRASRLTCRSVANFVKAYAARDKSLDSRIHKKQRWRFWL